MCVASGLALPPVWAVPRKNCGGGREQRRSLARWGGAERPALESVRARNTQTCAQFCGAQPGGHSAARPRAGREGDLGSVDRDLSPDIALSCPLPSSRPLIWSLTARPSHVQHEWQSWQLPGDSGPDFTLEVGALRSSSPRPRPRSLTAHSG